MGTRTLNEEVGEEDEEAAEEPSGEHALAKTNKTSNNRPQGLLKSVPHLPLVRADLGGHLKYSRRWSGVRAGVLLGAQGAVRRGESRGGL